MYIGPTRRAPRWPWLLVPIALLIAGFLYVRSQDSLLDRLNLPGRERPTPTPTVLSGQEYMALAEGFFAQGQMADAIGAYRAVIERDPSNSTAHARLGRLLTLRGRPAEGLSLAQRAV